MPSPQPQPQPRIKLLNKPPTGTHLGVLYGIAEDHLRYLRRFVLKRLPSVRDRIKTKWGSIEFIVRRSGADEAWIQFAAGLVYRPAPSFINAENAALTWQGYDAINQVYGFPLPIQSVPDLAFNIERLIYAKGYLFAGSKSQADLYRYTGFEWVTVESSEPPVTSLSHGFFSLIKGRDGEVYAIEQDRLGGVLHNRVVQWDEPTDQFVAITNYVAISDELNVIGAITPESDPFTSFSSGDTTNDPPPELNGETSFFATFFVDGVGHLFGVYDRTTIEANEIESLSEFWNLGIGTQTAPNEFALGPILDRPSGSDARWLHKYGVHITGGRNFPNQISRYGNRFVLSTFIASNDDPYLGAGQEVIASTDGADFTQLHIVKNIEDQTPSSTDRFFTAASIQRSFDWLIIPNSIVDTGSINTAWTGVPDGCDVKEFSILNSESGNELIITVNAVETRISAFSTPVATARAIINALNNSTASGLHSVFAGFGVSENTVRIGALLNTASFSLTTQVVSGNTQLGSVISVLDAFPIIQVETVALGSIVTYQFDATVAPPIVHPTLNPVETQQNQELNIEVKLNSVSDPATRWDLAPIEGVTATLTPAANNRSAVFHWSSPDKSRTFQIYMSNAGGLGITSLSINIV